MDFKKFNHNRILKNFHNIIIFLPAMDVECIALPHLSTPKRLKSLGIKKDNADTTRNLKVF
jgi:hypothetical protein